MSIRTGRAQGTAQVSIDHDKCNLCKLCLSVCSGDPLYLDADKIGVDQSRLFGCIGCGQCVAVCPQQCIEVRGRTLSPADFFPIPPVQSRADYDQLTALMYARRSTRSFKDKAVEPEHLQMIIKAVSTAPMGLPPSDVEILIVQGREKVREFGDDIVGVMAKSKWMFSPLGRVLLRPFFGKELTEQAKTFLYPAILHFLKERPRGEDSLFYHALLVMYFHVSVYADPADPLVSATYAMLAAESLGMGSCMIGTPAPFIKTARKLKEKYGIPPKNQQGIALILGYPQVKYSRSLKRSLAGLHFH